MDSGPILGISGPVLLDLQGHTVADLVNQFRARPERRPAGGYGDALETVARANQDNLKVQGDWTVLPAVAFDFARGRFGLDATRKLCYCLGKRWHPVETVVYGADGEREVLFRSDDA